MSAFHRNDGALRLREDPSLCLVTARCSCGSIAEEPIERNRGVKEQLQDVSCQWCGKLGDMKQVIP